MKKSFLITKENANYILGFVEGEGSFNTSVKVSEDYKYGVKISLSFNISQKDLKVLEWIQTILKTGIIRARGDGVYYYEVNDVKSLTSIIIPLFCKYKFKTLHKQNSFKNFCEILQMVNAKKHLSKQGIVEIYKKRAELIVSRRRKYSLKNIEYILEKSSETIRQT